jgi:hypothetical protein
VELQKDFHEAKVNWKRETARHLGILAQERLILTKDKKALQSKQKN